MEEITIATGGPIVVLAYLIASHIIQYFRREKEERCKRQIDDLWDWHNQTDSDGVKIWYVRASLSKAIETLAESTARLAESTQRQTELLREIHEEMRDIRDSK